MEKKHVQKKKTKHNIKTRESHIFGPKLNRKYNRFQKTQCTSKHHKQEETVAF